MFKLIEDKEIKSVMEIINDAKKLLSYSTQWQQGYPNEEILLNDIKLKRLFGYYENNNLLGIVALVPGFNPDYETIDGEWIYKSGDSDITIHRIAVREGYHNLKIGDKMLKFAINYAKDNGFKSLKADTYDINIPLRTLCEKNGFIYRGIIKIVRKEINPYRVAYELIIE